MYSLTSLREAIRPLVLTAEANAEPPRYLQDYPLGDNSETYCPDCAEAALKALNNGQHANLDAPLSEAEAQALEEIPTFICENTGDFDSLPYCHCCGVRLVGTLTEACATEECQYYLQKAEAGTPIFLTTPNDALDLEEALSAMSEAELKTMGSLAPQFVVPILTPEKAPVEVLSRAVTSIPAIAEAMVDHYVGNNGQGWADADIASLISTHTPYALTTSDPAMLWFRDIVNQTMMFSVEAYPSSNAYLEERGESLLNTPEAFLHTLPYQLNLPELLKTYTAIKITDQHGLYSRVLVDQQDLNDMVWSAL